MVLSQSVDQTSQAPPLPATQAPPLHANQTNQAPPLPANQTNQAPPLPANQTNQAPPLPANQTNQAPPLPANQTKQAPPLPANQTNQAPPLPANQTYQAPPLPANQTNQAPPLPANQTNKASPSVLSPLIQGTSILAREPSSNVVVIDTKQSPRIVTSSKQSPPNSGRQGKTILSTMSTQREDRTGSDGGGGGGGSDGGDVGGGVGGGGVGGGGGGGVGGSDGGGDDVENITEPGGLTLPPRVTSPSSTVGNTSSLSRAALHTTRSTPSISPTKKRPPSGARYTSSSSTPSILPPSTTPLTTPTNPPTRAMPTAPSVGTGVCPADTIRKELLAMSSLQRTRKQEEGVADSVRDMMSQLVSKETLAVEARARRSKSSHALELEHFSVPFSPRAWLGLVEERRLRWARTHVPWRSVVTMVMLPLNGSHFYSRLLVHHDLRGGGGGGGG